MTKKQTDRRTSRDRAISVITAMIADKDPEVDRLRKLPLCEDGEPETEEGRRLMEAGIVSLCLRYRWSAPSAIKYIRGGGAPEVMAVRTRVS